MQHLSREELILAEAKVKDALFIAINNDDVNTVKHLFLTESILRQCPIGYLDSAIKKGNLEIIALLLTHGAYNNKEPHFDGLYAAIQLKNNLEIVALLLSHGAHINEDNGEGCTVLHYAVWQWDNKKEDMPNRHAIVKMLLEAGADVNAQGNVCCCMEGYTPLHVAALWNGGDPKTVALLLNYNPDLTIKSTEYETVLEACRPDRNPEIWQLLTIHKKEQSI